MLTVKSREREAGRNRESLGESFDICLCGLGTNKGQPNLIYTLVSKSRMKHMWAQKTGATLLLGESAFSAARLRIHFVLDTARNSICAYLPYRQQPAGGRAKIL